MWLLFLMNIFNMNFQWCSTSTSYTTNSTWILLFFMDIVNVQFQFQLIVTNIITCGTVKQFLHVGQSFTNFFEIPSDMFSQIKHIQLIVFKFHMGLHTSSNYMAWTIHWIVVEMNFPYSFLQIKHICKFVWNVFPD